MLSLKRLSKEYDGIMSSNVFFYIVRYMSMYRYNIDLVASHSICLHYKSITPKTPRLAANGTKEKTIKGMKPIAIEVPFRITHGPWRKPSPKLAGFF